MTGGRVKRVRDYIGNEPFMLTYGDGVADVDIRKLVAYHLSHGKEATVTSIQPLGRFGALDIDEDESVRGFREKPKGDGSWINGGFFVLQPEVLERIEGDTTFFEKGPMESLARDGELMAYKHHGFWQPMDTLRDKNNLDDLWGGGQAPWKVWADSGEV